MADSDGSVIIDVNMNVKQADKQLGKLKKDIEKTEKSLSDLTEKRREARGKSSILGADIEAEHRKLEEMKQTVKEIKTVMADKTYSSETRSQAKQDLPEAQDAVKEQEKRVRSLESEWNKLENSVDRYDSQISSAQSDLELQKIEAGQLQEQINEYEQARAEALSNAEVADQRIVDLNRELLELKERQKELESIGAGLGYQEYDENAVRIAEINSELKEYKELLSSPPESDSMTSLSESAAIADQHIVELNQELLTLKERKSQLESDGFGLGYQEYDDTLQRISEINKELKEYQSNLLHIEDTQRKVSDASQKASFYMGNFGKRLKGILASAFIFNILSSGLRQFTGWLSKSIKSNDQARQSIAKLKGALLTLAQPIVEFIIPAFTMLVNILARVVTAVAQLVSAIFGKTLKQSKDGAKAMYEEANAIKGVGAAADEAAGSLAGFDEINTISTENASGAGGGASSDVIKPDFTGMIEGELSKIAALVGAALLAVGAILTFSGANIPLGIALMAAGAVTLVSVIATDWGSIVEMLRGPIGLVTALVSAALLALGAILAFSGVNIPLGIALMAIGALGLAAVVAANWDSLSEVLQGPIGLLTAIVSAALLVVGALLAFSGVNIPLGIALMAAGAIGLAAVVAVNWDSLSETLQGPIGRITTVVSAALLALGALLAFSGVNIPLGIALMALGAIGLATTAAANWDSLSQILQGPIGQLTAVISGALLALGALLAFSGVNIPLGIALMAAGALGIITVSAVNWEALSETMRGPIGNVTSMVSLALLALGAILAFSGVNLPLGISLLAAGAVGLAATVAINWDCVEQALKGPTGAVTALISTALLALGAVILFSGANIPMGLGLLVAGAAGLAASIAANWEIIQTTLQGPIGTITAVVSAALLVLGAVLLFSGANIPLGLGLLSVGAVGLATTIAANWDTITAATGETVHAITAIVSAALLVLGVVLLFTGAAAPLGLGLLAAGAVGLAATIVPNWNFILEAVQNAWSDLKTWWGNNAAKFFTLDYWADLGKGMIDGLLRGLRGAWDSVTKWARGAADWIGGVFSGSSTSAPSVRNTRTSSRVAVQSMPEISTYSIPALARGAVIPPNREFMAVLGDQSSGNNLEAPESLIRKIVREEAGSSETTSLLQAILEAIRAGHIIMVDRRVLGQTVTQEQNRMTRQSGKSVVLG